jgi:hypothetical protein
VPSVLKERASFRRSNSSNLSAKAGWTDSGRSFAGVHCFLRVLTSGPREPAQTRRERRHQTSSPRFEYSKRITVLNVPWYLKA